MDNQHKMIKGYRDLSQDEIDLMNSIKAVGEQLSNLVEGLYQFNDQQSIDNQEKWCDEEWIHIGRVHLQQGIMALVRSVAKPESF